MSARWVIVSISQDAPTDWISPPKFEIRLDIQIAVKMRCRNGAVIDGLAGASPAGAVWE
jgi:hypothetical protein